MGERIRKILILKVLAGGGDRTHTPEGNTILSRARLPVPPRRRFIVLVDCQRLRRPIVKINSVNFPKSLGFLVAFAGNTGNAPQSNVQTVSAKTDIRQKA